MKFTPLFAGLTVIPALCGHYGYSLAAAGHRKNLDYYNRALLKKSKTMNFTVVPMYINLDTENNYPVQKQPVNQENPKTIERQNNGVHPARAGYDQMGDTLYCWVKAMLAEEK